MKTIKFIPKKKYILAFMISGLFYFSSYAQDISDRLHFNVDWQMNAPLNTNFADKISGWGMNLEGGYFLTPHWSLGAFLDFHTNHKYVPTRVGFPATIRACRFIPLYQQWMPETLCWHQDRNHVCPKYNISEYYKSDR